MNVLCVGLLSRSLLLVTDDFYVFDLPADAMRNGEMYINSRAMKIKEKWPTLWENEMFQKITGKVFNSFTVRDSEAEYLAITTWIKTNEGDKGVFYDLTHDKVLPGWDFRYERYQVLISATERMQLYALHQAEDGSLEVCEYQIKGDKISEAMGIREKGEWHQLCSTADGQIFITGDKTSECTKVEWQKVLKGFIDGDQVYLFGSVYVYTFNKAAFSTPKKLNPLKKKRYDSFFICHPDYFKWALITMILLILLLLLLLLIWFCCCRKRKKKDKSDAAYAPKSIGPLAMTRRSRGGTKKLKKTVTVASKSAKSKPKSTGPLAMTRRSKGGTKRQLKGKSKKGKSVKSEKKSKSAKSEKKSKSAKSEKKGSKFDSHHHDATGRSAFKG